MATLSGRSPGTTTDTFVPAELESALAPLANEKVSTVDFELERYEKNSQKPRSRPRRPRLLLPVAFHHLGLLPQGAPENVAAENRLAELE